MFFQYRKCSKTTLRLGWGWVEAGYTHHIDKPCKGGLTDDRIPASVFPPLFVDGSHILDSPSP
jgi:hypothetical protein